MNRPAYPAARKVECTDSYCGVSVADPYRWLEDNASSETAEWIAAQNGLTGQYLSQVAARTTFRCRFEELLQYPRYYDLVSWGSSVIFKKNSGLQNQLVVYIQHRLDMKPEVLIDPTQSQPDGTTRVTAVTPSRDGRYLSYGLSRGGSDWQEYFIKDMTTKRELPEVLRGVKISLIAWRGNGFYYSRYQTPRDMATAVTARNENHQVCYHRVGTPQSADTVVYQDPAHPHRLNMVQTTEDERFAILNILDFAGDQPGRALWLQDKEQGGHDFVPLVTSFDTEFHVVDNEDDALLVHTNRNAPNWRLVLIDPARPSERDWRDIIPEKGHALELVTAAGGKLFGIYRRDAAHRLYVFDRAGRPESEIPLPGIGTVRVFPARREDTHVFWSFTSFTVPTRVYRYDVNQRISSAFQEPESQFEADQYVTKQVFCTSKDGTQVPVFLVHKKELQLTGQHPLLLEGYGGNGMSVGPSFDPLLIALLERGVVYALACLRGGGEYGEMWHQAGWREKKQNVFADCIAAAEWLQANRYTSPERSALFGISNGGLMVGAVMTQRPDLFKVALPGGAIMDMLRFQKFTVGANWSVEYGSSDDPQMLPFLLAYSPLHHIRDGVSYPATLATVSRYDDRVVPAHSFKFIATLQERAVGPNPYLIRIESTSGHGSVSLPQLLDERADQYAFLLAHTVRDPDADPTSAVDSLG